MKYFSLLFALVSLASASALARTVITNGTGYNSNYCTQTQGQFCYDEVKRNAEDQAKNDLQTQCQMQSGSIEFPSCDTNCNPMFYQYGAPDQYVDCNSRCEGNCQIPD